MADILIKGMEMPKEMECVEILLFYNGHCAFRKHERDEWVEAWAVALPEHGDLKDSNIILRWLNAKADNRVPVTLGEIIDFIEKQPTVLEASE